MEKATEKLRTPKTRLKSPKKEMKTANNAKNTYKTRNNVRFCRQSVSKQEKPKENSNKY